MAADTHQGYLAITLLMHEESELVRLVINSIRKDLEDNNEVFNCLALHEIANLGGKDMAEALVDSVFRSMISPCVNDLPALAHTAGHPQRS